MHQRQRRGRWGEKVAAQYLQRRGYSILRSNVQYREGEIDLIAKDGPTRVYIEVKLRTSRAFGSPEESVTPAKIARIRQTVERHCDEEMYAGPVRIDVISIEVDGRALRARIKHLKDVG